MTDAVDKNIKRQRAAFMTYLQKLFDGEIMRIMSLEENLLDQSNIDFMITIRETIRVKLEKILEIDQRLADECEEDAVYTTLLEESMDYEIETKTKLASIDRFIAKHTVNFSPPQISSPSAATYTVPLNSGVKEKSPTLKPLNVKNFSGDPAQILKTEHSMKEKESFTMTSIDDEKNSAASLHTGSEFKNTFLKPSVIFNRSGHKGMNCFFIEDLLYERKRTLQMEDECFVCLRGGHNANTCRAKNNEERIWFLQGWQLHLKTDTAAAPWQVGIT